MILDRVYLDGAEVNWFHELPGEWRALSLKCCEIIHGLYRDLLDIWWKKGWGDNWRQRNYIMEKFADSRKQKELQISHVKNNVLSFSQHSGFEYLKEKEANFHTVRGWNVKVPDRKIDQRPTIFCNFVSRGCHNSHIYSEKQITWFLSVVEIIQRFPKLASASSVEDQSNNWWMLGHLHQSAHLDTGLRNQVWLVPSYQAEPSYLANYIMS